MRRDSEELDGLIVEALRRVGPITAPALAAVLRARGDPMSDAQAYRVLKRLMARGDIRQIWLGRRYALRTRNDPPSLMLACSGCGDVRAVPSKVAHTKLRAAASAAGFEVEEIILEVVGRCADTDCAASNGAVRRRQ